MISAIRHHGPHVDHSSSAIRARLDAAAREQAQETWAALRERVSTAAVRELSGDQRLLDLFA